MKEINRDRQREKERDRERKRESKIEKEIHYVRQRYIGIVTDRDKD